MPTNENDEFPRFLETGVYEKVSPSRACLSNAMNVGHPSNLARFFDLYDGTVDRTGVVHRIPNLDEMRKQIYSVSISDRETKKTIKRIYDQYRVLLEPHGAVGWRGLEVYLELFGDDPALRQPGDGPSGQIPRRDPGASGDQPRPPAEHEGHRRAVGRTGLPLQRLRRTPKIPAAHLHVTD